ncbi:MAG: diguanylate cyclase, partial [Alkalimonas sp.]|nr:diguanylate cyclase [Alkalimonas sp.]
TKGGLARFDGLRFVSYQLTAQSGLGSNDILALLEDQQQRFWIGTEKGLFLFNEPTAQFESLPLTQPDATILTLHQDQHQQLWVGTDQGLVRLSASLDHIELMLPDVEVKFLHDENDTLWIGTKQGLYYKQPDQPASKVDLTGMTEFAVKHERIFDAAMVGERLYLATQRDGLLIFNTQTMQIEQQWLAGEQLISNSIWSLVQRDNELWLGYFYDGIAVVSLDDHAIKHYRYHPQIQYSIPHDNTSQLFFDQDDQLWVATTNGLAVANPIGGAIIHLGEYQNITNKHVWSVAATDQDVWFGTESGLNHFDLTTHQLTTFPASFEPNALPRTVIWSLIPYQDKVLLGTNNGLLRFDPATAQIETILGQPEVYSLRQFQQQLHIGFYDGSFAVMDLSNDQLLTELPPLERGYLTDSQPFKQGFLLASSRGLWHLPDQQTSELATEIDIEELQQRHITSLLLDHDRLWVATQDHGLFILHWLGEQWHLQHHLTTEQGLAENQLRALAQADNGDIWLSGMRTISRIQPDDLTITLLSRHLHWLDMEFHANAVSRLPSERLAFGGNQGLVLFSPEQMIANTEFPTVHLTSIQVMAESHPAFTEHLTIKPGQSYFAFEFAALEYLNPERIHYQYRLHPFMSNWRDMSGNQLSLSQLAYGQYELQVRSTNADGFWSPTSKTITLDVIPPWWLHRHAKIAYALLGLLVIGYIITTQIRRNLKLSYIANHDNLTKLANRRYFNHELEQRLQQAKKNHHQLALMYFDLNKFKELNDTHGHDAGDQLLVETAMKLKQASRSSDFTARLGGDEFVLILDQIQNHDELLKAIERLCRALNSQHHSFSSQAIEVSCSIGVAIFTPQHPVSAAELLKQADSAMYQSKTEHKPWCLYTESAS